MINYNQIMYCDSDHKDFYTEALENISCNDVYRKALFYCLGLNKDTRNNINRIYDFKEQSIKTECINEPWQTNGSRKVVRMAFNLYNDGTPTLFDINDLEDKLDECNEYSVVNIFSCSYAPYFYQAVCIRFPEYTNL